MRFAILTFGCRTNQADSFDIERDLHARGAEPGPLASADLVVVNTCSVTATAEQEARRAIRHVIRLNPGARIVATGCYAARAPQELAEVPLQFFAFGTSGRLPPWASASHPEGHDDCQCAEAGLSDFRAASAARHPGPGTQGRTLFLLRVQSGCDSACTYCVVPSARGPSRSATLANVSRRVSEAAAAGFKQVMITGVHLGSYGRDLTPAVGLPRLVAALAGQPDDVGFRLSAIEPMDFDRGLVDEVAAAGPRFAPHFHLPLQHASDPMLAAMGRPYRLSDYAGTVNALRHRFPDAAIGTDVMVGFPGETDEDFETLAGYLAASPITYLHVFPFSPRPGTVAASLTNRPPGVVVRCRVNHLRALGAGLSRTFRERFVGEVRDGLTIDAGCEVLTDNYLRVRIVPGLPRNERVKVKILADEAGGLTGEVVGGRLGS